MTQHPRFPGSLLAALGDNFEWYIGRDGQQFGPVNSQEMGKLIELGHLKPADLVWRAGFSEWQVADRVFMLSELAARRMAEAQPAAAAQPPPAAPQPQPAPAKPQPPAPAQPEPKPASAAPQPAVRTPTQGGYVDPAQRAAAKRAEAAAAQARELRLDDVTQAIQAAQRDPAPPVATAPPVAERRAPVPAQAPEPAGRRPQRPEPASVVPARELRNDPAEAPPHHRKAPRKHPPHDHSRKRRRSRAALAITLVSLVLIGGAAGAAYVWQDKLARAISRLTVASSDVIGAGQPTATPAQPAAVIEPGSLAAAGSMESNALWKYLRSEFPEWYAERQREAARLRADKKDDTAVTKYLAEQLVALRRNYMDDALGASPEALRKVADTFVANLRQLNRHSVDACYNFISHGEASSAVVPILGSKEISDALETQLLAVFEAVAEGRRQRLQHLPPRKEDYDQLVRILGRTGWTNLDLQVFSDPRALQRAQPVVVCRLVREWFQSQLALDDAGAQTRLLVESLRPVVGG